jgi:hypothetical protein
MISANLSRVVSVAASLVLFLFGASAHALTIDTSSLDTMHSEAHGPFGVLNWSGVELKVTQPLGATSANAQISSKSDVRIETGSWMTLDQPQKMALSRVVKAKDGTKFFEHADVLIEPANPVLQITSLSSAHLTEIARLDPKVDRAKTIPIYAYRVDAKHLVVLVDTDGESLERRDVDTPGACAGRCVFDQFSWNDHMVNLTLGADRPVAQARGDVVFDAAPKGETNAPRTYIVNASYTQSSRDPEPILAINLHTMETIFRGDMDGE